jgi:hypothetical protein
MLKTQVQFVMTGKTEDDIYFIGFTSQGKLFHDRFDSIEIDYTNELVKVHYAPDDHIEFWDFSDINVIAFKPLKPTDTGLLTNV